MSTLCCVIDLMFFFSDLSLLIIRNFCPAVYQSVYQSMAVSVKKQEKAELSDIEAVCLIS